MKCWEKGRLDGPAPILRPSRRSPIQEVTQHLLIRAKDTAATQEMPRDFGALPQEAGSKTKYSSRRCFSRSYHLGNYKGFRNLVLGTRGQRSVCLLHCRQILY